MKLPSPNYSIDSGIYILKFEAVWCGPCKAMAPTISKLEGEFPELNFLSIDIDDYKDWAKRYNVKSIPTILILKDGIEINRIIGAQLITPLRKIFREVLNE